MSYSDSRGLLKSILGLFSRKAPEKSTPPTSLTSQALGAWVRTDAYLQHNLDDFDEIDPDKVSRTLRAFENLVQYDSEQESDSVSTMASQQSPVFSASHFLLTDTML
jgi:hypothetical protein